MKLLDNKSIRKHFNENRALDARARTALRGLSRALHGIQQAGIDVRAELTGWVGSDSFNNGITTGQSADCSGILYIAGTPHVLTLLSKENDKTCSKFRLSYYNKALGDIDSRNYVFDVGADEDAYIKLQKKIIELAARTAGVNANDPMGAFPGDRSANRLLDKPAKNLLKI